MADVKLSVSLEDKVTESAKAAAAAIRELKTELGGLKAQTSKSEDSKGWFHKIYESHVLRNSFREIGTGIKEIGSGIRELNFHETLAGGTEAAAGFAEQLSLINPILGVVGSGVVRLAGSVVSLTAELASFALEVTNTNDRIKATFEALGGTGVGSEMLGMINELSTRLPQSREQIADWAKEIEALGINDIDKVRAQTTALASAQAIMGESGVSAYTKLLEKIRLAEEGTGRLKLSERKLESLFRAGLNVEDVAHKMGMSVIQLQQRLEAGSVSARAFGDAIESSILERGQAPLEVMMHSIDAIKRKGEETFGHLFDGIDTKPLTDALLSLVELGDQGEPSGQALKDGVTSGINEIIKKFARLTIEAEIFFLKLEIWWVKSGISIDKIETGFKNVGRAIHDLIHPLDAVSDLASGIAGYFGSLDQSISDIPDKMRVEAYQGLPKGFSGPPPVALPGHASGGMVERVSGGMATIRPARNEGLASIGVGERIVPATQPRTIQPYNNQISNFNMSAYSDTPSMGKSIHIDNITIQAPSGITNAQEITVTGLTLALERMQLASGR